MRVLLILQALDGLLELTAEIPALMARFQATRDEIAKMHAEGRSLQDADWDAVHAKMNENVDAILAAAHKDALSVRERSELKEKPVV